MGELIALARAGTQRAMTRYREQHALAHLRGVHFDPPDDGDRLQRVRRPAQAVARQLLGARLDVANAARARAKAPSGR